MYPLIRACLFKLDPERAHALTLTLIRCAGKLPLARLLLSRSFAGPSQAVQAFGLRFKNPVGLAAGYDKDGLGWRGLALLGFGHIEVGTVTLKPQPGNPKPRLFRLVEDQALINRMGFPGRGASFVARQLKGARPADVILGVNIGKNKDTLLEEAGAEYAELVQIFAPDVDYLTVNVSSPNTAGLRNLQARHALEALLAQVGKARSAAQISAGNKKLPILVKLAPDLDRSQLEQAVEAIVCAGMDGIIASNTTLARGGLSSSAAGEAGGLSGAPLFQRSLEMVQSITKMTSGAVPVVAAGGIMNGVQAKAMLDAGAALVQIYTGLIYTGPALVRNILTYLHSPD